MVYPMQPHEFRGCIVYDWQGMTRTCQRLLTSATVKRCRLIAIVGRRPGWRPVGYLPQVLASRPSLDTLLRCVLHRPPLPAVITTVAAVSSQALDGA